MVNWIAITDRLPENDGGRYLISDRANRVEMSIYVKDVQKFRPLGTDYGWFDATHWAEVPEGAQA